MSDTPKVETKRNLPRNELDQFFRGNPRVRKAFEDLLLDVGVTLPEAIGEASDSSSSVLAQRAFSQPSAQIPQPVDDAARMLVAAAFARSQPPAQPVNDVAGLILAGQIFGA